MTLRIRRGDAEVPTAGLTGQTVAVIGYGNQGHAHALNLRDSGIEVVVGARSGSAGASRAAEAGFRVVPMTEAAQSGSLVIMALPDEVQPEVYEASIAPSIRAGAVLGFLHGFCIRYQLINVRSDVGAVMIAPKGPGATLRARYVEGTGIPCLLAIHQDSIAANAEAVALAWANGIGCARAAVIDATFADETETDLFGEQAVLCGGLLALVRAAFETLVAAGYPSELAYLECCHEVKQVADLMYARGPAGMCKAISNTAEFGAYRAAKSIDSAQLRELFKRTLAEIQSGAFAANVRSDYEKGFPWFNSQRKEWANHPQESAGEAVRKLMPWLNQS